MVVVWTLKRRCALTGTFSFTISGLYTFNHLKHLLKTFYEKGHGLTLTLSNLNPHNISNISIGGGGENYLCSSVLSFFSIIDRWGRPAPAWKWKIPNRAALMAFALTHAPTSKGTNVCAPKTSLILTNQQKNASWKNNSVSGRVNLLMVLKPVSNWGK